LSEGRWASRARGSKWAWAQGRARRMCGRVRVHGGEIVGERLGITNRWGRRDRERVGVGGERRRQLGPTEQQEREGVSALGLAPSTGGARLSSTEGARAWAGLSGLV
jgi:hypothetical protein